MLIIKKQITDCISAAQEADKLFALHTRQNGDLDRSIDDFREFIKTYGHVEINDHKLSHEGQPIRGYMLAYDDKYEIVLLANQDSHWRRFVEFKELFHVILDTHDKEKIFRNTDFVKQVEKTLAAFPDMENRAENCVAIEQLAEIAAMEFLIPFSRRKAMAELINSGKDTLENISEKYKIPASKIDLYLSENYINRVGECMPAQLQVVAA